MKRLILTLVLFSLASLPVAALCEETACPNVDEMQKVVNKTFSRPLKVERIEPGPISGLCAIQVKVGSQHRLIYTDSKGEHIILGEIYSAQDGKNITKAAVMELNRFSPEELEKLASLAAFTVGEKGPVVYLVTDPQCPYCKKAEGIIAPMAERGKLQLKVLLFPLKFHKGAKEESISIICDNKGLEGLKNRYRSENQCEEGRKKVEETIRFLQSKGVSATPTYIFPDGRYHSGVLKEDAIVKRISQKD